MIEYVTWADLSELRQRASIVIDNTEAYLTLYNGIWKLERHQLDDSLPKRIEALAKELDETGHFFQARWTEEAIARRLRELLAAPVGGSPVRETEPPPESRCEQCGGPFRDGDRYPSGQPGGAGICTACHWGTDDRDAGLFPTGAVCDYVYPQDFFSNMTLRGTVCGLGPRACPHRDPSVWCSHHEAHRFVPRTALSSVRASLLRRFADWSRRLGAA